MDPIIWKELLKQHPINSGKMTLKPYHYYECITSKGGPAPTAVWSKAHPLTACCLSLLSGFESWPGNVRKLPVTCSKAVVLAGYSGFLRYLQLASHASATIGINVTESEIPNTTKESYLQHSFMAE